METEPNVVGENIMDDPSVKDAYDIIYAQVEDIIADGSVDEENVAYIIKAVLEAIDAVGKFVEWDGPTKASKAKALIKHVLTDLYAKGKMTEKLYKDLMTSLTVLSGAMFTLAILADKGKVLFQHMSGSIQRACTRCKNRRNEQILQDAATRERAKMLKGAARGQLQARSVHVKSLSKK